jgi:ribonuclease-3
VTPSTTSTAGWGDLLLAPELLAGIASRIGFRFNDEGLLALALTHRSWCAENDAAAHNERLEFLGDAVLGLVVTDHIFSGYPDMPEGQLAKVRAAVVNAATLAGIARELGLGDGLLLGRGEALSGGRDKQSLLANALEAVIGAVYLDGGWSESCRLVVDLLGGRIAAAAAGPGFTDYKTRLQEAVAHRRGEVPRYRVVGRGPDHDKWFVADVMVAGLRAGTGEGRTKKEAEQAAARAAWESLGASVETGDGGS